MCVGGTEKRFIVGMKRLVKLVTVWSGLLLGDYLWDEFEVFVIFSFYPVFALLDEELVRCGEVF